MLFIVFYKKQQTLLLSRSKQLLTLLSYLIFKTAKLP